MMLIVNFDEKYCAKTAFLATRTGRKGSKLKFVNNFDNIPDIDLSGDTDSKVLVVMDMNIVIENTGVDKAFEDRYHKVKEAIEEEKEKKSKAMKDSRAGYLPFKDWKDDEGGWGDYSSEKKTWEMTDREWQHKEEGKKKKFGIGHARALLNSIFDSTFMGNNYEDCIIKIQKESKLLKDDDDMFTYMTGFQQSLQDHFDVIWPGESNTEYVSLMRRVAEYLSPYKYLKLAEEIIEAANDEIRMVIEEDDLIPKII